MGRPRKTTATIATALLLGSCGVFWNMYTETGVIWWRILTGLCIGVYTMWLGNGQAIPAGWFSGPIELMMIVGCMAMIAIVLVNPPEKTGSFRKYLFHPTHGSDHEIRQLPGIQEAICHLLGIILILLNTFLLTWRLIERPIILEPVETRFASKVKVE